MARARNIKPGFFVNGDLSECEPLARLLFIGLWTLADCEGRLKDRPRQIKAQILPYDNCDADILLTNLERSGFIQRYLVLSQPVIQVLNFLKHQNPHKNERDKGSLLPGYSDRDKKDIEEQEVIGESRIIGINLDKDGTNPADSLLLNPDSLTPLTESLNTESGVRKDTMSRKLDDAGQILDYLNLKAGKGFEHVASSLGLIRARIKEGATVEKVIAVIDSKIAEWPHGHKCHKFIRPKTLFNATNFANYVGELGVETPEQKNARELNEWANGSQPVDNDAFEGEFTHD